MTDLTRPLADRLGEALLDRADQIDDPDDTCPGWAGPSGRGRKAETLRKFADHLSSEEAAPTLIAIVDLEPIFGPLDVAWAIEIAETPENARGPTYALSFLLKPESPQAWLEFLRAHYEADAIAGGRGDQ
ncbi:MAG: hypothetical protein M3Q30_16280 [Actinomycetota bacterium]|nr:hypothetical protein [Actinomycetota bacterium]